MPTTRSNEDRRAARLPVVSRALQLFNTRRTNTARRDKWMADQMRFAGEEATFCLATARRHLAEEAAAALNAKLAEARIEQLARLPAQERSARINAIRNELDLLPYRNGSIAQREDELEDELEVFRQAEALAHQWELDGIAAEPAPVRHGNVVPVMRGILNSLFPAPAAVVPRSLSDLDADPAMWAEWDKAIDAGNQPAADALWSDGATDRAIERVA